MTGLKRILSAVAFARPDRVPVVAQVFAHAASLAGVPISDYLRDGELLARCQCEALEHYGYDAVFALMDAAVETEAMGSRLAYPENQYPITRAHVLSETAAGPLPEIPDPRRHGRMPQVLEAAHLLRRRVGDETLVVGCVSGPMTLAAQLMGLEPALYLAIDKPERFAELLDLAAEVAIRFGVAQIEAGAHLPLVFDPSASPEVVPPAFFREFVQPRLARVFTAFRDAGGVAGWLHIAGPVQPILPLYPAMGVDIANFDYCVTPAEARQALPATCLDGNIKPMTFVHGEPEEIARLSASLLDAFADRGGFLLSSGCEIPPEARPENVTAMVQASRERVA